MKLPHKVLSELRACGRCWHIEKRRRHNALVIDGRIVTMISRCDTSSRNQLNLLADIKRYLRGTNARQSTLEA